VSPELATAISGTMVGLRFGLRFHAFADSVQETLKRRATGRRVKKM
jgi:hypothetical protein